MDPSLDPNAASCWNNLRAIEWWLHRKTQAHHHQDSRPRRATPDVRQVAQALGQFMLHTEIPKREPGSTSLTKPQASPRSAPGSRHPFDA